MANDASTQDDFDETDLPRLCRSCLPRHRGVCGALGPRELAVLSRSARQVSAPSGTELIADSEPVESYANVMSGVVKLSKMLADGREQVVGLQFAPDFLGRLFGEHSRLTAEAASEVRLCRFPRTALDNLVNANPELERRLLKQALAELDEARDWMVTLGRKTASEKVASFLYLLAIRLDPADDPAASTTSFDLPLTRSGIGDFLGLTVETVSRQLTRLRIDKVIEIASNRHVTVPDLERLRMRCG